jgi:intracellular sulfur oxidation DsrE/DsrF family protein
VLALVEPAVRRLEHQIPIASYNECYNDKVTMKLSRHRSKIFAFLLTLSLPLLGTGCASRASAQQSSSQSTAEVASSDDDVQGAVMIVRKPRHVRAAIVSMRMLKEQDPEFEDFQVFVLGPAIGALSEDHEFAPLVREALSEGIHVSACSMSAENQGIPDSAIMPEVGRVRNALVESLKLQQRGYSSIEL